MAVVNLTEARIRELEPGSGIWRDEQVKGLMVVCHATTKTYAVQGDVRRNGRHVRTVRMKIDRVDRIGLREARNRAKAIMSQIQSGIDPTARGPKRPASPSLTPSTFTSARSRSARRRSRAAGTTSTTILPAIATGPWPTSAAPRSATSTSASEPRRVRRPPSA